MPSLRVRSATHGVRWSAIVLAVVAARADAQSVAAVGVSRISLPVLASRLPDTWPVRPVLRTRTVHFPDAPAEPDRFAWLTTRTTLRYGRSLADFYPVAGSGLRLGGGTRFYMSYAALDTSAQARIAMQYDARGTLAMPTLRDGYSSAPIALVGYGTRIGRRWTVGVDAGAMLGQAMTVFPYDDRPSGQPDDRVRPSQRLNPLVDVTVALGF